MSLWKDQLSFWGKSFKSWTIRNAAVCGRETSQMDGYFAFFSMPAISTYRIQAWGGRAGACRSVPVTVTKGQFSIARSACGAMNCRLRPLPIERRITARCTSRRPNAHLAIGGPYPERGRSNGRALMREYFLFDACGRRSPWNCWRNTGCIFRGRSIPACRLITQAQR
jgi:hypothetical protein